MRSVVVAGAAMVLAAGCVSVMMDFTVNSDGSGSFEIEMSVSQEFLEMAAAFQERDAELSAEETCQEMMQGEGAEGSPFEGFSLSGEGFEVEQEVVADGSSCSFSARAEWPADQADLVFALLGEDNGPMIERVGSKGWGFQLPLDLMDDGDSEEFGAAFAEALDFSVVVSATLPGQPVEHNADRADSGCNTTTFHWDIDLVDPPERLMAEADGTDECGGGGGLGTGAIVAVILIGILVVAVGAVLVLRRSRQSSPDPLPDETVDNS